MPPRKPLTKVERTLGGGPPLIFRFGHFFTHVNLVAIVGDDFDPKTKPS